eukprot:CAMPEP_0172198582 /NCGR_PEP_ID=MMETSP1050-20130122/28172_1 /TAXON_ID=233186 /ORGANISM="Cryptomonas curvata, Strain CCAP979/52" /LENGTH=568 /DNA_ID=CAMNT_0012875429 /DNA_START=342 /DNA_END=2048 /DNA_ORIENTATION=-
MSLSPTGKLLCTAESMDRDGYPKGLISRQLYYCTSHVANSPSQGFYKLSKATNELQDALGLGQQGSRRGFFCRLHDAFPPQELAIPQDPPQVAMVAMPTTAPRPQGVRKEKVDPQLAPAHNAKAEPDSIMKDVKSELGAFCTLVTKVEALITRKRKPDDRKDQAMASIAHAVFACNTDRLSQKQYSRPAHRQLPLNGRQCRKTRSGATMARGPHPFSSSVQSTLWSCQGYSNTKFAQGKNLMVQKGTAASSATQNMPPSYMDSSETGDEEKHFANYAQACNQVEAFVVPFACTMVQSAKPEQSQADYFGLPALRLSNKKRTQISEQLLRLMIEMEYDREPTIPSQPSLVDSTALFGETSGTPDLALLQALTRVEGKYHRFRLLREFDTDNAVPSEHSNDVAPELVSSSEEDEDDRPRALLSAVPSGTSAAAPGDKARTRHVVIMDSVHFPDAVLSSGMVADGSVACAKTITTLYEQAAGPEPTPKTSSRTDRKARDNSGKRNGTATTVSKRSQRSGVMNRKSASRDESPSHRRRPSFDTTSSASCSPNDQRADDAGAAPTFLYHPWGL